MINIVLPTDLESSLIKYFFIIFSYLLCMLKLLIEPFLGKRFLNYFKSRKKKAKKRRIKKREKIKSLVMNARRDTVERDLRAK